MDSRNELQMCANCDRTLRSLEELLDLDFPSDENQALGLPANSTTATTDNLTSHFASIEGQAIKVTDFTVGFSDCQRSVTLCEALKSVFTFNFDDTFKDNPSSLAFDNAFGIHKNVVMCVDCAEVVSTLYKSYVTLMEMSKATGMLAQVIRQAQRWHIQRGNYTEGIQAPSNYVERHEIRSTIKIEPFVGTGISEDFDEGVDYAEVEGGANSDLSTHFIEGEPIDAGSFDAFPNLDGQNLCETPLKREMLDEDHLDAQCIPESTMRTQNVAVRRSARNHLVSSWTDVQFQSSNLDPCARKTRKYKKLSFVPKLKKNRLKAVRVQTPILPLKTDTDSQEQLPTAGLKSSVGCSPNAKSGRRRRYIPQDFPCDQCNKVFHLQWKLTFHRLSVHEGKKPKECKVCRLKYYDAQVFKTHVCIPKSAQALERRSKPLHCNYCGKFVRGNFTRHCLSHDMVTFFPCTRGCKRTFKTTENLARHEKLHDRPPRTPPTYQCSICGKVFKAISGFKAHMVAHEELEKFLCTQCGLSFGRRNALDRHTSTVHVNEYRFKCPICDKGFKRRDKVAQHLSSKVHPKELVESFRSQGITAIKINTSSKTKSDLIAGQEHSKYSSLPFALQESGTSSKALAGESQMS